MVKVILQFEQRVGETFHDYELPFEIGEYTDPIKVNELWESIEDLNLNRYLIEHIEYSYGIDFKNTDIHILKNYLDNVYTIEASNNNEFAQNYMYEFYNELLKMFRPRSGSRVCLGRYLIA